MTTFSDKIFRLALVLIICATLIYTFKPNASLERANGISVSGQGIAKVQPDTLTLSFNVQEKAETTKEAQTKIDEISSNFMQAIMALGVEKRSIQTSNYSVYPSYYRDNTTSKQIADGYNANQTITVELSGEGFVALGEKVLSTAPTIGNISINASNFSVKDKLAGEVEARKSAIQKAEAKAQQLADLTGIKLGKALTISESVSNSNYSPIFSKAMNAVMDAGMEESVSLAAGENEITVNVNITYEIK
jgi:uncharacterized protein YggE